MTDQDKEGCPGNKGNYETLIQQETGSFLSSDKTEPDGKFRMGPHPGFNVRYQQPDGNYSDRPFVAQREVSR